MGSWEHQVPRFLLATATGQVLGRQGHGSQDKQINRLVPLYLSVFSCFVCFTGSTHPHLPSTESQVPTTLLYSAASE